MNKFLLGLLSSCVILSNTGDFCMDFDRYMTSSGSEDYLFTDFASRLEEVVSGLNDGQKISDLVDQDTNTAKIIISALQEIEKLDEVRDETVNDVRNEILQGISMMMINKEQELYRNIPSDGKFTFLVDDIIETQDVPEFIIEREVRQSNFGIFRMNSIDLNCRSCPPEIDQYLLDAVKRGHVNMCDFFIKNGANVNYSDDEQNILGFCVQEMSNLFDELEQKYFVFTNTEENCSEVVCLTYIKPVPLYSKKNSCRHKHKRFVPANANEKSCKDENILQPRNNTKKLKYGMSYRILMQYCMDIEKRGKIEKDPSITRAVDMLNIFELLVQNGAIWNKQQTDVTDRITELLSDYNVKEFSHISVQTSQI